MRFQYARQTYVFGTGWVPSSWLEQSDWFEQAVSVDSVSDLLSVKEEELSRDNDECDTSLTPTPRRNYRRGESNDEDSE